jgi:hypothetical protein
MGQYFEWLVPIVVNVVMNTNADDYKQIYHEMMDKLDAFVDAIKHILHKDPAPAQPAW